VSRKSSSSRDDDGPINPSGAGMEDLTVCGDWEDRDFLSVMTKQGDYYYIHIVYR
jgi:hypothetical protein